MPVRGARRFSGFLGTSGVELPQGVPESRMGKTLFMSSKKREGDEVPHAVVRLQWTKPGSMVLFRPPTALCVNERGNRAFKDDPSRPKTVLPLYQRPAPASQEASAAPLLDASTASGAARQIFDGWMHRFDVRTLQAEIDELAVNGGRGQGPRLRSLKSLSKSIKARPAGRAKVAPSDGEKQHKDLVPVARQLGALAAKVGGWMGVGLPLPRCPCV